MGPFEKFFDYEKAKNNMLKSVVYYVIASVLFYYFYHVDDSTIHTLENFFVSVMTSVLHTDYFRTFFEATPGNVIANIGKALFLALPFSGVPWGWSLLSRVIPIVVHPKY